MTSPRSRPEEVLCREILEDARRQAEEILSRARSDVGRLRAEAAAVESADRNRRLQLAEREAERARGTILASAAADAVRGRATRMDAILEELRIEIQTRLEELHRRDARTLLFGLLKEPLAAFCGQDVEVRMTPDDLAVLGPHPEEAVRREVGVSVGSIRWIPDETLGGPGPVISSHDGHLRWDNRLSSRMSRLWPALRRQIALRAGWTRSGSLASPTRTADPPT